MAAANMAPDSSKGLEFSGPVYAALLPAHYLLETIKSQKTRPNGRTPSEFRQPSINIDSLTYSNGSTVIRMGGTTCVSGVRAEIAAYDTIPNPPPVDLSASVDPAKETEELSSLNLIVPNVDLGTGCMPSIPPGQAPTTIAQALADRLRALLINSRIFHVSDLRILYTPPAATSTDPSEPDVPPQTRIVAYWTLHIDTVFISADGNLFDCAWIAVLASFMNTNLPKAWWDADIERVLCSDNLNESRNLRLSSTPVASSFAVFEPRREKGLGLEESVWVLADADAFEEGLCKEVVTVVSDRKNIVKILKSGGMVVGGEEMKKIVQLAEQRWQEVIAAIKKAVDS